MTRLTPLQYDQTNDSQRELWDAIVASRGGDDFSITGPDGELVGPFNAFATSPEMGSKLTALGGVVRFKSQVDRRLLELAICATGAHWKSNFEFFAHGPMAIDAGVTQDTLDALERGEAPNFTEADEETVYQLVREMLTTGRVAPDTYAAASTLLGEPALVDLVATVGYYSLISLTLNTFEVALPPGESPFWP